MAGRFNVVGECWEFNGYREGGYGRFRVDGRLVLAHRYVLSLRLGRDPVPDSLHTCDNPPCFRPIHLYEGTAQDNADDRGTAGRTACGIRASKAKLTPDLVRSLREEWATLGLSYRLIGARYGISKSSARAIVVRNSWKSVA